MDLVPNLPLYLSAIALVVSVLLGLYFYKKIKVIHLDLVKMREFKNQLNSCHEKIVELEQKNAVPPKAPKDEDDDVEELVAH